MCDYYYDYFLPIQYICFFSALYVCVCMYEIVNISKCDYDNFMISFEITRINWDITKSK